MGSCRIQAFFFRIGFAMLAFTIFSRPLTAAENLSATLDSGVLTAGDQGTLRIVISLEKHSGTPRLHNPPEIKGLTWSGQSISRQISIINGRRSGSLEFLLNFTVYKPGNYIIPPLRLDTDRGELFTNPVSFQVTPPPDVSDENVAAKQLAFMILTNQNDPEGKRKIFYEGETLPLILTIFVRFPYDLLDATRAGFFADPEKSVEIPEETFKCSPVRRTFNGKLYRGFRFLKKLRFLASGKCTVQAQFSVRISDGDRMDFFRMPSFLDEKNLSASFGPLTVRALPPPPEKVNFSKLTGQWKVKFSLSPGPFRAGEPVTLRILISGRGDLDALEKPVFAPEGFRVYPPEIKKNINAGTAEIILTLIPLTAGEKRLDLPFTVFDTVAGIYRTFRFKKVLRIERSAIPFPPPDTQNAVSGRAEDLSGPEGTAEQREKASLPKGVLYLHDEDPDDFLRLPLWRNAVFPGILLISFGLLFCAAFFLISLRKRAFENDPDLVRRMAARAGKHALLRKLKNAPEGAIPGLLASELSDYLNALLSLPPGAGLSSAAQKLAGRDPELADALRTLDTASWSHGTAAKPDPAFRKKLLRALARLSIATAVLAILFHSLPISAAETDLEEKRISASAATAEEAKTAYDSGNFQVALNYYRTLNKPGEASAENLYNIGNCLYQLGDLPRALVAYERASRLAPRDRDIRENLNLTRRKLALAERRELRSPGDLPAFLRDSLRLDEWILAGAAGLMLCLAGTGLFFRYGRKILILFYSAGVLFMIFAAVAIVSQLSATYGGCEAIIVQKNAPVYSLPSERSGRIEVRLRAGSEVGIVEDRQEWVRVRFGHEEGWMKQKNILRFWDHTRSGADKNSIL